MPDQNSPNTLPFAARDAGPDGTIPADALLLLAGCRDRLAHGVAKALAENLGAVADDLLGMADRATSLEQQQRYFAAMEVLTSRGQDFVERFRDGLCAHFDVGLAALRRDRPSDAPGNACDLHPVTADAFKRDLVLG